MDPLTRATLSLALLVASSRARAEGAPSDQPVAEALFRDGRQLMESARFSEACPKLAESQRIDPKIGTLLNLAACHELQGRTASAWAEYAEAATQATRAGRAQNVTFAREHALLLEAKLSRVKLSAERPAEGLEISLDGQRLGPGVLGTALPVDPGTHAFVAVAPGRQPWSTTVEIPVGPFTKPIEIPELARATTLAPPVPSVPSAPTPNTPPRPPAAAGALPWVLGGIGVVGLGLGTFFGVQAFSKNTDASQECKNDRCTQRGIDLDRTARAAATGSTLAFAVGAASLGGALYVLFLRAPPASPVKIGVGPGPGVHVRGVF